MSRWKGSGLLLVLAIPLLLYALWQVKGVVRADLVSDPPADRGGSKEQLLAAKGRATAYATDVRKASEVALQFRPPTAADGPQDVAAAEVVRAAAARTADLSDLDQFIGMPDPKFGGRLKVNYGEWKVDADKASKGEEAVRKWLASPPAVTDAATASAAMAAVDQLIREYLDGSRFASRAKAAVWRVEARLKVVDGLAARADGQYRAAMKVSLPLEPDNAAVKTARGTLEAIKAHAAALTADAGRAAEVGAKEEVGKLRPVIAEREQVAKKWAAGEELLGLFARDDLFTNSGGAAKWLEQVAERYRQANDITVRETIREKVQEFCEAFVPPVARLDDKVMFNNAVVARSAVRVEYEPMAGAQTRTASLSDDPDGLNEYNAAQKHPLPTTEVRAPGATGRPADLKPTAVSEAAVAYNAERKKVGAKWTVKSAEVLKKKCEAKKDLVDQLKFPAKPDLGPKPELWARLTGVADGLKANADLVETTP